MARSNREAAAIRRVDMILKLEGLPTWTETQEAVFEYISDTDLINSHNCTQGYCFACELIKIYHRAKD